MIEHGGDLLMGLEFRRGRMTPFHSPGGLAILGRFTHKRQGAKKKDIPARNNQPVQF